MRHFKVCITNYSHIDVDADNWEAAKKIVEDKFRDLDGPGREMITEIEDNSTQWFVDYVEESEWGKGDTVTCQGEGDTVFTISQVDHDMKRAYLIGIDGKDITGWKALDQLRKSRNI